MHESTKESLALLPSVHAKTPLLEQTVILPRRRSDVRGYENSNDESIYRNDTGHDNWNK
jgi:hypothetical protein